MTTHKPIYIQSFSTSMILSLDSSKGLNMIFKTPNAIWIIVYIAALPKFWKEIVQITHITLNATLARK